MIHLYFVITIIHHIYIYIYIYIYRLLAESSLLSQSELLSEAAPCSHSPSAQAISASVWMETATGTLADSTSSISQFAYKNHIICRVKCSKSYAANNHDAIQGMITVHTRYSVLINSPHTCNIQQLHLVKLFKHNNVVPVESGFCLQTALQWSQGAVHLEREQAPRRRPCQQIPLHWGLSD